MRYTGGCHCGEVSYEVEMDLTEVLECNCSICSKKGTLLAFTPEENFFLKKGSENLQAYLFNKKVIQHLFCKTCGVQSFSKASMPNGMKMVAINARCLDGVDLTQVKRQAFNGRALP